MKNISLKCLLGAALIVCMAAAPKNKVEIFAGGFKGPENLVFDGKGALYMTDTDNLWKISPDGKSSSLYTRDDTKDGASLCGVCMGLEGKVYFSASNRILILNPPDNSITELASGFKLANGICMDDWGNLFVADTGNKTLFIIPAGSSEPVAVKKGVGMINGVKWDRENGTLYYTVSVPGKLAGLRIGENLDAIEEFTVARFPSAALDDFTMDSEGNFYVCLWFGGKVVKVGRDGGKQVIVKGIDGPSAVAFGAGDMSGKLFITVKGGSFKFKGTELAAAKTDAKGYRLPFMQ